MTTPDAPVIQADREAVEKIEFGFEAGQVCWRNGCQGVIEAHAHPGCSCHISPPCSGCVNPREYCATCDWDAREEVDRLNDHVFTQKPGEHVRWTPRPLDPRKLDWHSIGHTNSSMIKRGVYPETMTRDEVEKAVRGTFGGRFNSFGNGRFEYVAYTD